MLSSLSMDQALKTAKNIAGGNAGLAEKLGGITPQAISQWERVPASRVLDVERITGISRHDLRADIFGPAPATEKLAS